MERKNSLIFAALSDMANNFPEVDFPCDDDFALNINSPNRAGTGKSHFASSKIAPQPVIERIHLGSMGKTSLFFPTL